MMNRCVERTFEPRPLLRGGRPLLLPLVMATFAVWGGCRSTTGGTSAGVSESKPTVQTVVDSEVSPVIEGSAAHSSNIVSVRHVDVRPQAAATAEAIPLDSAVLHGRLKNGLSYFIRANEKPAHRAELRLVVNAGSLQEDEDQRGLAHFVEHMAFNGTSEFPKQELVNYLERIGMRLGPDINAYTNFDETVYMLQVPTDTEETLLTGLDILAQWAHAVEFEGVEVDKERGVVTEEWRQGRGAGGRIRDAQLPVTFYGSRYAERQVIGDPRILSGAPAEALRRFYRDWYRPDLMAVVVVGDLEAAAVEAAILDRFATLVGPASPRPRMEAEVPDHPETLTSIVRDPEATSINVMVGYKRAPEVTKTTGDLRRTLIDGVYHGMMINRLQELLLQADPPYQFGYAGSGGLGRTKSIYRLFAQVRDGGVERGLRTLLIEAKRVREHGFLQSELDRAKTNILRTIDRAFDERDKQESSGYADEYVSLFLDDEPSPSIEWIRDRYHELVPGVELAEVNARAGQWLTEGNRIILVSGPDAEASRIPEEPALLAVFDEAEAVGTTPWVDRTRDEPLVSALPEGAPVVEEERLESIEAWRWKLANGVTVLLKPTDYKNDEVLLSGYSPGGTSLVADEDFEVAQVASDVVAEMGLGAFDSIELGKAMSGKVVGVGASISELSEGIYGGASPKDLDTLFELIYLRFVGSRYDERAFGAWQTTTRGQLENREASPAFQFQKRWNEVVFRDHPRRQLFTLDKLDGIKAERALEIYRQRFADASGFVFTIVGNFDLATMRPLVERWLGSLPNLNRNETWRDVGAFAEPGVQKFEVKRGLEAKSQVQIVFHGFAEWTPARAHLASSLGQALSIRLREVLREDLGGVYGVGVSSNVNRWPRGRYNSTISFGCDPERVEELVAAAFREIEAFQKDGPSTDVVAKIKELQRRSRESALQRNQFWIRAIESAYVNGRPWESILELEPQLEALTPESLRDMAREVFDESRYVQGVLLPNPEEQAAQEARRPEAGARAR